jgi:cephalosporin hydroxylase
VVSAPVETFQAEWELGRLVSVFDQMQPSTVLEIGAWHGGTLWHWLLPNTTVVVIDDEMRMADTWHEWAKRRRATLHLLQGPSQEPAIIAAARRHGPYEFVFIDGDHRYEAVRADAENYAPMVAPGGALAFHDIIERPGYGVSQVWGEIKSRPGARWMEIAETVEPGNESRCGIGILWL